MVAAAGLMFAAIDGKPLWNDEAFSFFMAHGGPLETLRSISQDTQPPLYYLTLTFWLGLGHEVFVLRSLSALAIVLAVVPLYDAGRRLVGAGTALLAALLFISDPNVVFWAQKARPYALQAFFVAVAFWGFVRILLAPEARQRYFGSGLSGRGGREAALVDLGWLAYAIGGALAMLTQQPAGFFVLGCNCAIVIAVLPRLRANRILLVNWVLAQLLLIAVWSLWLPVFVSQAAAHLTPDQISAKHPLFLIDGATFLANLRNLFSIPTLWRAQPPFVALYAVLACLGAVALRRNGNAALAILGALVVPLLACAAGFFLIHPVFGYVTYSFVWILVPYVILIASGITLLRPVALRIAVLGLVLFGNGWGLWNYYATSAPPIDQAAAMMAPKLAPGDGLVLGKTAATAWGLAYYLGPPYDSRLIGLDATRLQERLITTPEQALALPRVWVVLPDDEPSAVDLDVLQQRMTPAISQHINGPPGRAGLMVRRFDGPVR
jgi:4-amino-4-deoxy-L-arabinose transferase-like glycosyltransferase